MNFQLSEFSTKTLKKRDTDLKATNDFAWTNEFRNAW